MKMPTFSYSFAEKISCLAELSMKKSFIISEPEGAIDQDVHCLPFQKVLRNNCIKKQNCGKKVRKSVSNFSIFLMLFSALDCTSVY